jgi:MerR family transcriptional regulator, thiopeptide resistance regulator
MKDYTVRELARLSGVSVRTLHYYDACGLLKPARVGANRYRYYGEAQLLRLQQILLHRSCGLSLQAVAALLDDGEASQLDRLKHQREIVRAGLADQQRVLRTLDTTIAWLEGGPRMNDEKLFEGLMSPQQSAYEDWLVDRQGDPAREGIDASRQHLAAAGRDALGARMAELEELEGQLAARCARGAQPQDPDVSALLARHRAWVAGMWGRDCPPAAYAGLAQIYMAHPDFVGRYESRLVGFADWLAAAMQDYASRLTA